jgi:Caspase domain
MKSQRHVCALSSLMCGAALVLGMAGTAHAGRVALLIGVGKFKNTTANDLEGPAHDVAAMRDVLIRRWGFAPADVRTLVDQQATKAAIMRELLALKQRTKDGDDILYYVSGHGTSALNSASAQSVPLPHGTGGLYTYDFNHKAKDVTEGLIVGQRDLRPVFLDLERGGRHIWAISDSCYSGKQVRSGAFAAELPAKQMILPSDSYQLSDLDLASQSRTIDPYPYAAVQYLSAAADGERARDIGRSNLRVYPTLDGHPHGALTDALLRVLDAQIPSDFDGDGYLSLTEVHRAVSDFMSARSYGHTPQKLPALAEDTRGLSAQPVLKVSKVAAMPVARQPVPLKVLIRGPSSGLIDVLKAVPDAQLVTGADRADIIMSPDVSSTAKVALSTIAGDKVTVLDRQDTKSIQAQLLQLAWAHRLHQIAQANQRGTLAAEFGPTESGGTFYPGKSIHLDVRPDKAAHLLMLNINSQGKVSILYPFNVNELKPIPAGQTTAVSSITTGEPYGMDKQLIFAFDEPLPQGQTWLIKEDVDPSDGRVAQLESLLRRSKGRYLYAATELRILPKVSALP